MNPYEFGESLEDVSDKRNQGLLTKTNSILDSDRNDLAS